MKRTLRRESKAPETVGREAMDAGDPLLSAVCVARGGAWRAVANQYHKMECSCLLSCVGRRKASGVRSGGAPVRQFVSFVRDAGAALALTGQRQFVWRRQAVEHSFNGPAGGYPSPLAKPAL